MHDRGSLRITDRVQPARGRPEARERHADILCQRQDVQRFARDIRRLQGHGGQHHRAYAAEAAPSRRSLMRSRQAIALLALVGCFVALYLWLHALGVGGPLKCGTGGCDTVQTSRWAVVLGFPVALYGVVGYFVILVVAVAALRPAALVQRKWNVVLVGLASVGVLFTIYLTYLELFVIHAICRWCVGSAVIITAIWIVAVKAMRSVQVSSDSY